MSLSADSIVWGGNYFALPPSRGWLAWVKSGNAPSMADLELAWTSLDTNARIFEKSVKSASLEKNLRSAPHPTQKPLGLMLWCLEFLRSGSPVLDCFMGSGTTGCACVRSGRRFIGIDNDPRSFDLSVRRIEAELNRFPLFEPKPARQGSLLDSG